MPSGGAPNSQSASWLQDSKKIQSQSAQSKHCLVGLSVSRWPMWVGYTKGAGERNHLLEITNTHLFTRATAAIYPHWPSGDRWPHQTRREATRCPQCSIRLTPAIPAPFTFRKARDAVPTISRAKSVDFHLSQHQQFRRRELHCPCSGIESDRTAATKAPLVT